MVYFDFDFFDFSLFLNMILTHFIFIFVLDSFVNLWTWKFSIWPISILNCILGFGPQYFSFKFLFVAYLSNFNLFLILLLDP
jgi:hypothetical protein